MRGRDRKPARRQRRCARIVLGHNTSAATSEDRNWFDGFRTLADADILSRAFIKIVVSINGSRAHSLRAEERKREKERDREAGDVIIWIY